MSQVNVSDFVKTKLTGIKEDEQHTSIDSVMRMLLAEHEQNR